MKGSRRNSILRWTIALGIIGCVAIVLTVATRRGSASTPSTGTISPGTPTLNYDAGPFVVANQTPAGLGQLDSGPRCNSQFPCDSYELTVSVPAGYVAANPNAAVKVTMFWTDTGSGQSDYDLYIYDGVVGNLNGSQPAPYSSAGGDNPEVASVSPLHDGDTKYTVKIVPYQPTGETVHVRLELLSGTGPAGFPGFGGPDPTAPGAPRYQIFEAPAGSTAEASSGEMNIGFNPFSSRIMVMNRGPIWRLNTPENLNPKKPECCEAFWEDVTNPSTIEGVDPILWTDQKTGRTFAANSTAGTNGLYGYSDNDGDLWNPLSASPPNASSDHETIGSGPYPAALAALLTTPLNKGQAVYYCAQTYPTGAAACQRSDSLGSNYGPSVLIYGPGVGTTQCRGIHGHVHTGPDGTTYVPVRDCAGNAGLAVSSDGGVTWTERIVPNSKTQTHGSDPSVAIGANNTLYFFYVASNTDNSEGHMHVQISTDHGASWSKDTDLGISHGVINVAFPEAVAGDDNRAAVGFLGTDRPGFYEGITFPGFWYLYIATTYDKGDHWTIVNATPNDPVQGLGGIWQGGGSNPNRNLLDFNEVTMDDKGRVLFGYDDGCVDDCVGDPTHNSFGARIRVARQSGGKGLLSAFDAPEPAVPKNACLSGTRDQFASHLVWKIPDNAGSNITNYEIWRGTSSGGEVFIGTTNNAKPEFHDFTASSSVEHYFYYVKAINAIGTGVQSNEIDLVVTPLVVENVCVAPGLTKLRDASGDNAGPPGSDLLSFQLAQPFAADGNIKLIFTINTDNGQSPQPAGSAWYVSMKIPDPAPATTSHYKGVHMAWSGTTPTFESYTPGASTGGTIDGRFVTAGSQKPAEPESNYAAPFNKVVIVVKASDLGLGPGDTILGFVSGVSQSTANATVLYDQMPESLAYAGTYTVNANSACPSTTPGPSPSPSPSTSPGATPTPTAVFQFDSTTYLVQEDVMSTTVRVLRTGVTNTAASVDIVSTDGSARQKGDYELVVGRLTFAAGETEKLVRVLVNEDAYSEGPESANLLLQSPSNGTLGTPNAATLQIADDASEASSNPIDDSRIFVGTHYHDFLYRQSDQSGEDFWTNGIESCGSNAQCRQVKRIDTSTAFFLSIEFKETGYFVLRAHKSGFGSAKSNPRYVVFLRDQRQITNGVIVGQGDWRQQLTDNKAAYLTDFVSRSEFTSQPEFQQGAAAATYVDKLFANNGVTPTSAERNAAISAYGSGDTAGRAAALRSVVESGSVFNAQYNAGFVLMQYYGYLRRNPDDAPDNNFNGYDFWLAKMNSFSQPGEDMRDDAQANRRAQRAEMVRAFIESIEYRQRFFGAAQGNQVGPDSGLVGSLRNYGKTLMRYLVLGGLGV